MSTADQPSKKDGMTQKIKSSKHHTQKHVRAHLKLRQTSHMTSPLPSTSSTLDMSSPPTTATSQDANTPESPRLYCDMSQAEMLNDIQELKNQDIHYAANQNIASECEFVYNKSIKGDVLVAKDTQDEYFLSGVFELDAKSFFMTSDGKWNASNTASTRFEQVKPNCHLICPERLGDSDLSFPKEDFPKIISNLHAIEALGNPRKSKDVYSVIHGESSPITSIRLTHHLFVVRFLY